jgi:Tfp pilus tip-associated adhesin PilY1
MACRTGCLTKDHATWGDCLRASNIEMNAGDASSTKAMSKSKWNGELDAYQAARDQGIQPAGTRMGQIKAAVEASDKLGRAYDAGNMPKAESITKAHGAVMKEVGM